jgi:hypothetical protein
MLEKFQGLNNNNIMAAESIISSETAENYLYQLKEF